MNYNIHPNQISLFDPTKNRGAFSRERERERERVKRVCHIYNNIISFENLLKSWQEFLCGKRKRKDVADFAVSLMDNLISLHSDLVSKTYQHGGYISFKINDPKSRQIHKASVRDRLLHHAIYRVLYPYFDQKFIFDSYSCRVGKGTHKAMNRFKRFGEVVSKNNTRTAWVLKCDIKKFFANIDHQVLFGILESNINDPNVLWLFAQVIESFNSDGRMGVGLPLGNLTSQLLVNIYMNEFDQFAKRELKIRRYIRYADDFILLSENRGWLNDFMPKIESFLFNKLKLGLHPDKVYIKTLASGVDFLGWIHFTDHQVLRQSTKRRMLRRVAENPANATYQSYLGLLKHGNTWRVENNLNHIIKLLS